MERRTFLLGAAGALAGACLPPGARANVPKPYSCDATPPLNSRDAFISWMVANRGEDPKFLAQRWAATRRSSPTRTCWTTATSAPSC